ncbi:prepilin-type N-terminal cleavage/methylation domain-containing protein [Laspinema sp. D1]|uniref:Tfp pilus assembly protein FimT/FimU n=1 Tax=Laspinema palackyanum TaxID=3231601 RepID=UPI003499D71D|nr:prepilin-type N-terminal cleavage/methylation domain-containing protein [Laspinema sp. D2b]
MNKPMDLFKHLKRGQYRREGQTFAPQTTQGFTLLEVLMVVFIIGILAALAGPSWINMANNSRLNKAIAPIEQSIREARRNALQQKGSWRASFKQENNVVLWAVTNSSANPPNNWQEIEKSVFIDTANTTLEQDGNNLFFIEFDEKGNVDQEELGRITLAIQNTPNNKRCVKVRTILGAITTDKLEDCTRE